MWFTFSQTSTVTQLGALIWFGPEFRPQESRASSITQPNEDGGFVDADAVNKTLNWQLFKNLPIV